MEVSFCTLINCGFVITGACQCLASKIKQKRYARRELLLEIGLRLAQSTMTASSNESIVIG